MYKLLVLVLVLVFQANGSLPVVLIHGVASTSLQLNDLKMYFESYNLDVYVIDISFLQSLIAPLHIQLYEVCNQINRKSILSNGFNILGISQGGLLARGYVEKCNEYPVNNLLTWVAPHGGVYIPFDGSILMYDSYVQQHFPISNYWRDPYNYEIYLTNSQFLSQLNNELNSNLSTQQHKNLEKLKNFVLVWSTVDELLNPPQSGCFYTFNPESTTLNNTFYKTLLNNVNTIIYESNCKHDDYIKPECFELLSNITMPYLM